jgi:DNA helicase HerA-like ATPase
VLARLAFDLTLWSAGKLKLLVLCEEAHRYMPSDPKLGFAPTRHALSRIAKEGRKYGCYLGIVTQRPGELDTTILSQCSTMFAMRLANERDQEIIRSAIADSSQSALSFLSSMGQREAIAFGEGVATTMRMKFERLDAARIPGTYKEETVDAAGPLDGEVDLAAIVSKLRNVAAQRQPSSVEGEPVPQQAQAGDPAYRKPAFEVPEEPSDFNYGRRATDAVWRRPNRS